MVKWEEILKKVIPIIIVGGIAIWFISQIKPPPAKRVEVAEIGVG